MHDRIKITITRNADAGLVRMFAESVERLKERKDFNHPAVRSE